MNRNLLLTVIAVLCLAGGAFGYWFYQDQQRSGVDINIGPGGVSIQGR